MEWLLVKDVQITDFLCELPNLYLRRFYIELLSGIFCSETIFFSSCSECADTEQILEQQVLRAIFLGSIFSSSQMRESNPGRLGEKRKLCLCAMPSPPAPNNYKTIKVATPLNRQSAPSLICNEEDFLANFTRKLIILAANLKN